LLFCAGRGQTGPNRGGTGKRLMPRLHQARARRVIRPCPSHFIVERITQRVIGLLPARRRGIECLARRQVDTGNQHVHMNAAIRLGVLDSRPCCSISTQTGKGHALELI